MPKYEAWLPTWASVRYELETDEPISDQAELRRLMLEKGEPQGGFCHNCRDNNELDPSNIDDETALKKNGFEVYEME